MNKAQKEKARKRLEELKNAAEAAKTKDNELEDEKNDQILRDSFRKNLGCGG